MGGKLWRACERSALVLDHVVSVYVVSTLKQ